MNRTREKLKTVLICLLLVGMVYLTYSVWFFDSPLGEMRIENLFDVSSGNGLSSGAGEDLSQFGIRPLSVAIREDGVSRAILYDSAACDDAYRKLREGMAAAFRRGKETKQTDEKKWESAISKDGVLLDYSGNIPLEALKLWLGEENGEDTVCGRYFFFSTASRTMRVYVKNTDTKKVYEIETSALSDEIRGVLSSIGATPSELALLYEDEEFSSVYPEMIIPEVSKNPSIVSSYNIYTAFGADTVAACLETFRLRDVASSNYSEKDGTEVYIADMVTLRVSPTGIVSYSDLRDEADETLGIKINSEDTELPSFAEKCEGARGVVSSLAKKIAGAGGVYIISAVENGESAEIVFGRHINGIPVDMKDTSYFAKVIVKRNSIGEVRLNLSGYETMAQTTEILPARLAVAALKGKDGVYDLNLRYKDTAEGGVVPSWFVGGIKKGEK